MPAPASTSLFTHKLTLFRLAKYASNNAPRSPLTLNLASFMRLHTQNNHTNTTAHMVQQGTPKATSNPQTACMVKSPARHSAMEPQTLVSVPLASIGMPVASTGHLCTNSPKPWFLSKQVSHLHLHEANKPQHQHKMQSCPQPQTNSAAGCLASSTHVTIS